MRAAGIARQLGAARQGVNWRADCPLGCGYTLSFRDAPDGRLLAHCFGGCNFDQIMAALVVYGLLDDDDAPSLSGRAVVLDRGDDERRRRKIEAAREIYASGVQDARVQIYLRSRGIEITSPVLKFQEQAPHRLGARLPAMVAPIVDINGEQIGVHLTYLRADGCGKADLPKEFQRECRGAVRGGTIRLLPFNPEIALILAEGVETAFSAAEIFGLPSWAVVSASGFLTTELRAEARHLVIAADHDEAGRQCVLAARDRWAAEGRSVQVKVPPTPGQDFNDVLLGRRRDAAR
jgi:phage/plasmid primase-like uncharacterized protein